MNPRAKTRITSNDDKGGLPCDILIAEFDYARETAAQAMEDRHKMVNFYLIIVGVLGNAMAILLAQDVAKMPVAMRQGRAIILLSLLFLLFGIGLLYLFKIIHLRMAWYNSALCMNQIKDYFDKKFPDALLKKEAFRWTTETLHAQDIGKLTSLFGLSAILIMAIDSLAFAAFVIVNLPLRYFYIGLFLSALLFFVQTRIYTFYLSGERVAP